MRRRLAGKGSRLLAVPASERGQTLVEFALLAPLLFIILFGIIQFGFLFGGQIGLTNAAREAARYAAVIQTGGGATAVAAASATYSEMTAPGGYLARAIPGYQSANLVTTGPGRTAVCYIGYPNADGTFSIRVRVQVAYRHPLFVPFVGIFVDAIDGQSDNAFRVGVSEEMRVENPVLDIAAGGLPVCP
jgi:Flp pilus assembly protein TadG